MCALKCSRRYVCGDSHYFHCIRFADSMHRSGLRCRATPRPAMPCRPAHYLGLHQSRRVLPSHAIWSRSNYRLCRYYPPYYSPLPRLLLPAPFGVTRRHRRWRYVIFRRRCHQRRHSDTGPTDMLTAHSSGTLLPTGALYRGPRGEQCNGYIHSPPLQLRLLCRHRFATAVLFLSHPACDISHWPDGLYSWRPFR